MRAAAVSKTLFNGEAVLSSKDRQEEYAIAINDQYRICFIWTGKDAEVVEITDYH